MTKAKQKAKERDNHECQFCGISDEEHKERHAAGLHAHHILKQSDGGDDVPSNYITVCHQCHSTMESSHAKALSQLRGNILNTVKEEFVAKEEVEEVLSERVVTPSSVEAEVEYQLKEAQANEIKEGCYYNHQDYGGVHTYGFDFEVVAATPTTPVHDVAVIFKEVHGDVKYKEKVELFSEKTGRAYERSHEVRDD